MTDDERKALIKGMKKLKKKFLKDPDARLKFFIKAGILNKKGNLTKPYRDLKNGKL